MTYPFVIPATGQTTNQLLKINLDLLNNSLIGVVTLDTDQTITGEKVMEALVLDGVLDADDNKLTNVGEATIAGDAMIYEQTPHSLFDHFSTTSSTHVDGTEDDLYSDTIPAATFNVNGDKVVESEQVNFVSHATAARRLKKYFGGTLIFDTGAVTLSAGADFSLRTEVIRESSSVVRVLVTASSTSASTIPYVTYTRITGLTISGALILKTTGIASGVGAAAADISDRMAYGQWIPAA